MDPDTLAVRTFFQQRHIVLKHEWETEIIRYVRLNIGKLQPPPTRFNMAEVVFHQWLYSDLVESTVPSLKIPANARKLTIATPVLLQVESVIDISESLYRQYRSAKTDLSKDDADFQDPSDLHQSPVLSIQKKVLKLVLSDGELKIAAVISKHIPGLTVNTLPGVKVLLIPRIICRRRVIHINSDNCQVLGGSSELLLKENWPMMKVVCRILNVKYVPPKKVVPVYVATTDEPCSSKTGSVTVPKESEQANAHQNMDPITNDEVSFVVPTTQCPETRIPTCNGELEQEDLVGETPMISKNVWKQASPKPSTSFQKGNIPRKDPTPETFTCFTTQSGLKTDPAPELFASYPTTSAPIQDSELEAIVPFVTQEGCVKECPQEPFGSFAVPRLPEATRTPEQVSVFVTPNAEAGPSRIRKRPLSPLQPAPDLRESLRRNETSTATGESSSAEVVALRQDLESLRSDYDRLARESQEMKKAFEAVMRATNDFRAVREGMKQACVFLAAIKKARTSKNEA